MLWQTPSRRLNWISPLRLKFSPLVNFPLHRWAEGKTQLHSHSCSLFCVIFQIIHSWGTDQNFQQHQLVTFATARWTKARSRLKVCEKVRGWILEPMPLHFMTDLNHNLYVFKSPVCCCYLVFITSRVAIPLPPQHPSFAWTALLCRISICFFWNLLNSITKRCHLVLKFQ